MIISPQMHVHFIAILSSRPKNKSVGSTKTVHHILQTQFSPSFARACDSLNVLRLRAILNILRVLAILSTFGALAILAMFRARLIPATFSTHVEFLPRLARA